MKGTRFTSLVSFVENMLWKVVYTGSSWIQWRNTWLKCNCLLYIKSQTKAIFSFQICKEVLTAFLLVSFFYAFSFLWIAEILLWFHYPIGTRKNDAGTQSQTEQALSSLFIAKTQTIQVYFSTGLSLLLCVQKLRPPTKAGRHVYHLRLYSMPFFKS